MDHIVNDKKILFVAYLYPPAGGKALPGVQRCVKFIRYLPIDKKYVLTLKSELYPDFFSNDHSIALPVSNEVVIRVGSFDLFKMLLGLRLVLKKKWRQFCGNFVKNEPYIEPNSTLLSSDMANIDICETKGFFSHFKDFVSDILTFPDYAHGWLLPALFKGRKLIKQDKIDVIFATAMPWTSLLVGLGLKISTGAKLIVECRDPWVTNPFSSNKEGFFLKKMKAVCERIIVKKADCISLNTSELTKEFRSRYDFLPKDKFHTLINGYDSEDFKNVQITGDSANSEHLVISHIGFLYGLRDPTPMFKALMEIREKKTQLAYKIIFQQIGDVNLDYDINDYAKKMNLEENFLNLGQLTYNQALQQMASSDILLIIQPKTTTQIPSKLYEYIYFDKPIISIGSEKGALAKIIKDYEFGCIFSDSDITGISHYLIKKAGEKCQNGRLKASYDNRLLFDIRNVSNELLKLINQI